MENGTLDLGGLEQPTNRSSPPAANLANRPWPLEPLLRTAGVTVDQLAEILHVNPTTVSRRLDWGLTDHESDLYACELGTHPVLVWDDWNERAFMPTPGQGEQVELFDP